MQNGDSKKNKPEVSIDKEWAYLLKERKTKLSLSVPDKQYSIEDHRCLDNMSMVARSIMCPNCHKQTGKLVQKGLDFPKCDECGSEIALFVPVA